MCRIWTTSQMGWNSFSIRRNLDKRTAPNNLEGSKLNTVFSDVYDCIYKQFLARTVIRGRKHMYSTELHANLRATQPTDFWLYRTVLSVQVRSFRMPTVRQVWERIFFDQKNLKTADFGIGRVNNFYQICAFGKVVYAPFYYFTPIIWKIHNLSRVIR